MNQTDVIDDYSRRHQFAKISQFLAGILLLVSLSCLWLSGGAFGTSGEKIFLIVGGLLFVASIALAVVSVDRYRCPNCFKSLGVVRSIKYCPYCGINLQSASELDLDYSSKAPGERRGSLGRIGAKLPPARREIRGGAASGILSQGNFRPMASDFPEETYPKNIRLFTTSDEMELTKRYIRLISKDELPQEEGTPAGVPEALPRALAGSREAKPRRKPPTGEVRIKRNFYKLPPADWDCPGDLLPGLSIQPRHVCR